MKKTTKIGFVGQGWIGKNYSDNFEKRGYEVVRYDITPEFSQNKAKLVECDIIFVAVPTPSTPKTNFDDSILINAIKATHKDQIVVIKSTVQIGTTDKIQKVYPDRYILHSPEFLTEKTAVFDAAHPMRNIVGFTKKSNDVASKVMKVLPYAPFCEIVPCKEAELVKYAGNVWFYIKVMICNLVYDVAKDNNLDYTTIKRMMSADTRIGPTHLDVQHQGGRGAGGHCFIKDFVAFREMYEKMIGNKEGIALLKAVEEKNIELLLKSKKNLDLLKGVYGDNVLNK